MVEWPAGWPRTPRHQRRRGAFTYKGQDGTFGDGSTRYAQKPITRAKAIDRVQDEVRRMGGAGIKVETFEHLRLDGTPLAQQDRDMDPGAVVSFRLGNRPFVFPCDRYTHLEQNLAAIAATIEAKRAIERHGVSTLEREFEGYKALPPGSVIEGQPPAKSPWEVLGVLPGTSVDTCETIYKAKARRAHPDVEGGSEAAMLELNAAIQTIREGTA